MTLRRYSVTVSPIICVAEDNEHPQGAQNQRNERQSQDRGLKTAESWQWSKFQSEARLNFPPYTQTLTSQYMGWGWART